MALTAKQRAGAVKEVTRHGFNLAMMNREAKSDEVVARAAIKKEPFVLALLSDKLRNNKEFILSVLKENGQALLYTGPFRDNKDVVMAAVSQDGTAIKDAGFDLRRDKEVALAAVNQTYRALLAMADNTRDDVDVAKAAIAKDPRAFQYAGPNRRADKEIALPVITCLPRMLKFASDGLRDDMEVVVTALILDPKTFEFAGNKLSSDMDLIHLSRIFNDKARRELGLKVLQQFETGEEVPGLDRELKDAAKKYPMKKVYNKSVEIETSNIKQLAGLTTTIQHDDIIIGSSPICAVNSAQFAPLNSPLNSRLA